MSSIIKNIRYNTNTVLEQVDKLNASARETSKATEEIAYYVVEKIAKGSQEQLAIALEIETHLGSLKEVANDLQKAVNRFKVD